MKRIPATLAVTGLCLTGSITVAATADAGTQADSVSVAQKKPKKYKNCTALHKDFEHGIRKRGAKDKVRGDSDPVPARLIPVKRKLYKANTKLDRDKDGVACEAQ